jgi:hypothetical protein
MVFEEPSGTRSHDLARLREWIRKSGYMTSGPVTEIYHVHGGAGERETWRTEVQVPISVFQEPQGIADATKPKTGVTAEAQSLEVETVLPKVDKPPSVAPFHRFRSEKIRLDTAPVSGNDTPSKRPPPALPSSETPPKRPDPVAVPSSETPPKRPDPVVVPSAQTLMNSGRFEEMAVALLPSQSGSQPEDGVWRGQVALRVVAVARGIVQMYSDGTDWAPILSEALMVRFDIFVERLAVDPREQAFVTYAALPPTVAATKQAIMHDLDSLLVSVAGKSIDAEMAQAALVDIFQRVYDLEGDGAMDSLRQDEPSP